MPKEQSKTSLRNYVLLAILIAGCILCGLQFTLPNKGLSHHPIVTMEAFVSNRTSSRRRQQNRRSKKTVSAPHYFTVFSSSCSLQQHWESMVFFYHAMKVGQPGSVTRILSGCKAVEEEEQRDFFDRYIQPMGDFHIHFTPDFSRLHLADGRPYKYMNKPYGLRHWFEHALGLGPNTTATKELEDSIVILMDPDMILLRPLVHDFTDESVMWVEDKPASKIVRHGFPIAQQDGYLNNDWMDLPLNYTKVPDKDGPKHWNSGPPYLATVKDMYRLTLGWTSWAPKVLNVYPHLFAEMYGLIFAGVELNLPFTFIRSIVVSDTWAVFSREGWPLVDALKDEELCDVPASTRMPIALHYCKRYVLGKNFFSKYRLKKSIMDCDKALIQPPPRDVYPRFNYSVNVPLASGKDRDTYKEEHTPIKSTAFARREAFMLCAMIDKVNEALVYLKGKACHEAANLNQTYNVYNDPSG